MPNRSLGHSKSAFVGCLFVIQDDNDTLCLQTISASHCGCCHECRKICSVNFVSLFCVCVITLFPDHNYYRHAFQSQVAQLFHSTHSIACRDCH